MNENHMFTASDQSYSIQLQLLKLKTTHLILIITSANVE